MRELEKIFKVFKAGKHSKGKHYQLVLVQVRNNKVIEKKGSMNEKWNKREARLSRPLKMSGGREERLLEERHKRTADEGVDGWNEKELKR